MPTDDLRQQLDRAWNPPFFTDHSDEAEVARFAEAAAGGDPVHEVILDRLEAVARAHASQRIESFAASAPYCPFCGVSADEPVHRPNCPVRP